MKILCNLNLFTLHQNIYLIDDSEVASPLTAVELEQLPEVLATLCNQHSVHHVILNGDATYADSIAENIREFGLKNYSNNIKVEVI